jgi:hypothetical protein
MSTAKEAYGEAYEVLARYWYGTPWHKQGDQRGFSVMEWGLLQWEARELFLGEFELEYDGSEHPDWKVSSWRMFCDGTDRLVSCFRLVRVPV